MLIVGVGYVVWMQTWAVYVLRCDKQASFRGLDVGFMGSYNPQSIAIITTAWVPARTVQLAQ